MALVGVVAGALAVFVLIAVGPRTGKYRTLTVLSASMQPAFGPGSIVVVRPAPADELAVGDVITYRIPVEDRRVVTHRIVEIDRTGSRPIVRTQGDANNAADPWLARLEDDVAWRVAASVPAAGYAISTLREPLLARALVLVCPLLLCVLWLADLWRRPDAELDLPRVSEPARAEPGRARAHAALACHRSRIHTVLALASGTDRVIRWADEVASGRRWLRRCEGRA
ncbi:MAG: signal peptidase I [Acidimicrobiales bacterium]